MSAPPWDAEVGLIILRLSMHARAMPYDSPEAHLMLDAKQTIETLHAELKKRINEGGQDAATRKEADRLSRTDDHPVPPSPDDVVVRLHDVLRNWTNVTDDEQSVIRDAADAIASLTAEIAESRADVLRYDKSVAWLTAELGKMTAERDALRAENETWFDGTTVWTRPTAWAYAQAVSALHRRRAENRALRADAERYRWLRAWNQRWEVRYWTGKWWDSLATDGLDAAIDAERGKK